MNALAMETLLIFLDKLVPPAMVVFISITLILLFGDMIPQALCNVFGLAIGANTY